MQMRAQGASFVRTGLRVEQGRDELERLYALARQLCPDEFIAEETRELHALYPHVSLGLVDGLRRELATKLELPHEAFSRDRFSVHACGPVGLLDALRPAPEPLETSSGIEEST